MQINDIIRIQMSVEGFSDVSSIENTLDMVLKDIQEYNDIKRQLTEANQTYDDILDENEYRQWNIYVGWAYKRIESLTNKIPCMRGECFRHSIFCVYNCKRYRCDCKYLNRSDLLKWS